MREEVSEKARAGEVKRREGVEIYEVHCCVVSAIAPQCMCMDD